MPDIVVFTGGVIVGGGLFSAFTALMMYHVLIGFEPVAINYRLLGLGVIGLTLFFTVLRGGYSYRDKYISVQLPDGTLIPVSSYYGDSHYQEAYGLAGFNE